MVWFQCEDCGESLKKPKLPGHFRSCSAYKLSCIDCGETFTQDSVQGHTQCISEAEKYGPKGQGKASHNAQAKPDKPKPNADVDINVGLSSRPPWFCSSLCNTTATSKQTLLSHADGKKHRAKAKAFHAAQTQSTAAVQTSNEKDVSGGASTTESIKANGVESADECKKRDADKDITTVDAGEKDGTVKRKRADEVSSEGLDKSAKKQNNGEVIQAENREPERKTKNKEVKDQKIKWKKIVTKTLKLNADRVMKLKKLHKLVIKELRESGVTEDKDQLCATLMERITSSSRFSVDGKHIRLVAKAEQS